MNWIFFREEPPVLERSGPFNLVAKSHEVFWVLQASENVVKLLHFDDLPKTLGLRIQRKRIP
jgi:hypothetical protein